MREARDEYPTSEKWREQLRKDTLDAWHHYQATGLHLTGEEEADAWLAKLESADDAEAPECHV